MCPALGDLPGWDLEAIVRAPSSKCRENFLFLFCVANDAAPTVPTVDTKAVVWRTQEELGKDRGLNIDTVPLWNLATTLCEIV